ncbi:hypothetical protein Htur_0930 [Haloterrigena turkmenica DSM 5511]|uniref:Uncharacterized protein n=1 Tax=Haloterrigena turkmenica (strain ATCC 51198 / DSM 5511 / JCM 9101 / NCIMB 13204 / VKM B-1734 / 4k) TaxID=543526 RepID=D2RXZ0_HALTV|nr:hypothetical protein Htur_0930 [Haloterrigena turkmenica DSM 5511]
MVSLRNEAGERAAETGDPRILNRPIPPRSYRHKTPFQRQY